MNNSNHSLTRIEAILNKKAMIIYLIIVFLFTSFTTITQQWGKWYLKKDKNGIKVYIRSEPITGLPEFKGETKIAAPLSSLVAVLRDVEEYPQLLPGTTTANLLRNEKNIQISYLTHKCPFPFTDRDGIYSSSFHRNPVDGVFKIRITGLPDYLPKQSKKVRVTNIRGLWMLIPENDGTVKVIYQQYANTGGIPNWLTKLFSVNIPFKALTCLSKQAKLDRYQNNDIGDISTSDELDSFTMAH
ncbi:MAG: hypothetical protein ACI8P3_000105 [Saprospiraceae bacterium]|jgi:hypothetical protein